VTLLARASCAGFRPLCRSKDYGFCGHDYEVALFPGGGLLDRGEAAEDDELAR